MALARIESFDLYNGTGTNTGFQTKYSTNVVSLTSFITGRWGVGQAIRFGTTTGWWLGNLTSNRSSGSFGFAARIALATANNNSDIMHGVAASGVPQCGITIGVGGTIRAQRGNTGNVFPNNTILIGESAAGVINVNVWHYIEYEWVIHATLGRITVKVDGTTVLNLTNVNTIGAFNTGIATANNVFLGNQINRGWSNLDMDDMYEEDSGTSLGMARADALRPTADTATKQWVPDTGTVNFSRVNANLAQSVTYVQGTNVGDLDLYDIADLAFTPATVFGVQYNIFAQKTDVAARSIAAVGDIGGVQQQSGNFNLPSGGVNKLESLFLTKPGGGAWAFGDVNSLRIGPKVTI